MDEQGPEPETIRSHPARSGRVSYGNAILLHESGTRRVLLVPFFIPRTDHRELAVKITTYLKGTGPIEWGLVEEKSLSLGEQASRKLLRALETHLQVAETGEDGSYVVIHLSDGTAQMQGHRPTEVARALMKVLGRPEIVEHLNRTELSGQLLEALRSAIRLSEMRSAVATLRENLLSGSGEEQIYQAWCEEHSWAFGNAYVVRDDVRNISTGDRPDLLLPTVFSGYRDVVELKRPDMAVLNYDEAHRNYFLSSDVSKAIGQCHRYLDVLHEAAANGLRDHPEIVAYHPRAIIVIGRSKGWEQDKLRALHGLNGRLSGIMVMTYDQLLAQGERLVEMLGPAPAEDEQEAHETGTRDDWPDTDEDIPF